MTLSSSKERDLPPEHPPRPWTRERILIALRLKAAPVDPATGKPRKPNRVEDRIVVAGGLGAVVVVLTNITDAMKSLAKGPLAGTVPTIILVTGGGLVAILVLAAYLVARVGGRQAGETIAEELIKGDLLATKAHREAWEQHDRTHAEMEERHEARFRRIEQHLGLTHHPTGPEAP